MLWFGSIVRLERDLQLQMHDIPHTEDMRGWNTILCGGKVVKGTLGVIVSASVGIERNIPISEYKIATPNPTTGKLEPDSYWVKAWPIDFTGDITDEEVSCIYSSQASFMQNAFAKVFDNLEFATFLSGVNSPKLRIGRVNAQTNKSSNG